MIGLEVSFEKRPWEEELEALHQGQTLSAARFLALMEPEEESEVEQALRLLEQRSIRLDISDLPPVPLTGQSALRLKQENGFSVAAEVTAGLEPNDPLCLYLQELAATPAAGEPQAFARRYLAGEHHLAEQLVNLCLSQVVDTAMEYTGHGVLLLDLIQEGSLGLWQSILCYTGGDFLRHADWWIRFYMEKAITLHSRSSGMGMKLRQEMEDYLDTDQRLLAQLGRNPTVEEISQALHISSEDGQILEKMVLTARSLDQAKGQKPPVEEDPEQEQAVEDTAYFQMRQRIGELLSKLSSEDAAILTMRFGLEDGKPLSPVQVGEKLGLTPAEVVNREAAALACLREQ